MPDVAGNIMIAFYCSAVIAHRGRGNIPQHGATGGRYIFVHNILMPQLVVIYANHLYLYYYKLVS